MQRAKVVEMKAQSHRQAAVTLQVPEPLCGLSSRKSEPGLARLASKSVTKVSGEGRPQEGQYCRLLGTTSSIRGVDLRDSGAEDRDSANQLDSLSLLALLSAHKYHFRAFP